MKAPYRELFVEARPSLSPCPSDGYVFTIGKLRCRCGVAVGRLRTGTVKIFLVLALLAAACRSTYAEPREPDPRCSMIEAALAIDDAAFQRFYRGGECGAPPTGRDGGALIVDVQGLQLKDADTCPSKRFTVFHERRTRTSSRKILQLAFAPMDDGRTWAFFASYLDPPSHPDNCDGFDDISYYCHVIDGRVAREPRGWRAWVQHDQPASLAAVP